MLVHAGAHVEVDLAQVLDPGELWRLVAAAQGEVVPDPADLVAALVAILPAAVVVRPNRLSVFEVEALAQSLAAGRRPAFTVRRPACVRDIDATAATAKEG